MPPPQSTTQNKEKPRAAQRPSSVERLVARLREEGWQIDEGYTFTRCYHGYWQRSAGAWSWSITMPSGREIGSQDNVRVCLRAKRLESSDDSGRGIHAIALAGHVFASQEKKDRAKKILS